MFSEGPRLYDGPVHPLAQRVLSHLRRQELLKAGDRVGVAVSGGIDSLALLRLLIELRGDLGMVLCVVHFNHKLRGAESDADEQFVAELARVHDLELHSDSDDVAGHAREESVSVEAAARELRYGFFRYLLGQDRESENPDLKVRTRTHLDKIATGHTLDDQAETVLMRMIRGAGLRGLGGIYPRMPVEDDDGDLCGEIVRPLLAFRRSELEQYLNDIGQTWREDSTNADASLTRNRVRQLVLPLLEKDFNPAVAENLAELAEIARGEEDYWENEVAGWMGTTVHWTEPDWAREAASGASLVKIGPLRTAESASSPKGDPQGLKPSPLLASTGTAEAVPFPVSNTPTPDETPRRSASNASLHTRVASAPWLVRNAAVSRVWLLAEPVAVQRRLVKAIAGQAGIPLEFRHVEEILHFAAEAGPSGKELSLPLGWRIVREAEEIIFLTPDLRERATPRDYEYELRIPGQTVIPEINSVIEVQQVPAAATAEYNPDHLMDAESVPGSLRVRNWRPGDRFWPAHTKSPKKIKELLQERHVAQPERRRWPVIVEWDGCGEEIVWVRGFPLPARVRGKPGRKAIAVIERPLVREPE